MADDLLAKEIDELRNLVIQAQVPQELAQDVEKQLDRLSRMAKSEGYTAEYERVVHYIDWIVALPWNDKDEEAFDLNRTREILDKNHYGMKDIKDRIIEYLAVLKLHSQKRQQQEQVHAPIICLVGLVGTGKTTFAYSIAEAISRPFARIPFGGMGSARDLRGQSRQFPESEPGYVIKALRRAKAKNPVILLDEIDRIAEAARADIMGVLVELLDPEQNYAFVDHYIDFPFDLSGVIFIATANNTTSISTAVMDRLEPLTMPSYSDEEKIHIGKDYLFPDAMQEAGISPDQLKIEDTVWPQIVRPLGFDAGIRTLQRTIQGVTRKVARKIVEGEIDSILIKPDNIAEYIPKF